MLPAQLGVEEVPKLQVAAQGRNHWLSSDNIICKATKADGLGVAPSEASATQVGCFLSLFLSLLLQLAAAIPPYDE